MFTGLVETMAEVVEVIPEPPGVLLVIREPRLAVNAKIGDSVALNGCCLTAISVGGDRLAFQAGAETLSRTNLGELAAGKHVNVEMPLKAGEPIGGHYVTGHIDGLGTIDQQHNEADWCMMWIRAPHGLMRQMASKGSIAVDGVSLTLVDVTDDRFSVALIPHTLAATTLGERKLGDHVNLETDVLAKYVQRQLNT
jgi:riboflavin synthase